jgi:small subunit ribosomal protein S6e
MVQFKLVVSDPATKKSEVHEVKDDGAQLLLGRRIGEVLDATSIGVGKIMITGGSDKAGFPMRSDVMGGGKNYVLLTKGVGFRRAEEGQKKRKLVRGNTVNEEIFQVNAKKVADAAAGAKPS